MNHSVLCTHAHEGMVRVVDVIVVVVVAAATNVTVMALENTEWHRCDKLCTLLSSVQHHQIPQHQVNTHGIEYAVLLHSPQRGSFITIHEAGLGSFGILSNWITALT